MPFRKRCEHSTIPFQLNFCSQYFEIRDSRIILGINSLFYVTCLLPLFVSASHILLFTVADDVLRAANISLVANSTFKLFVYFALSSDFR